MLKINASQTNKYSEQHSEFYNIFEKQFRVILDSRPIGKDTYKSYIKNPKTESAIRRFVSNSEKGLLIIKGPQGSGKSSTLFALHQEFNKKKSYTSVIIDLLKYISLIPEALGQTANLDRQVAACVPSARQLITSSFQRKAQRLIDEERLNKTSVYCEVFRYVYDFHNQNIPSSLAMSKFCEMPDEKLISDIERCMENDYKFQGVFFFILYIYCLSKFRKKKRIVVILDNADHLPYAFIEAVTLCASQYSGYITISNERRKNDSRIIVGRIRVHFLVACRFHNYEKLNQRAGSNALGAHSHEDINHLGFSDIHRAVLRRIVNVKSYTTYTFKQGIRLTSVDARKCIKAYFQQLENSGCLSQLNDIHNHNVANIFDAIKRITQNQYFPKFDDFISEYLVDRKIKKQYILPINATIMLRCITRGNPDRFSKAIYPTSPNDIPNLYSWDGQEPSSFLLKLRILKILENLGVNSDNSRMSSAVIIYNHTNDIFPINEDIFLITINEMLREQLLFSYANGDINTLNHYDAVTISSRAEYLLNHTSRSHIIPLAFMEDFFIPKTDFMKIGLSTGTTLYRHSKDKIFKILSLMYDIELAQVNDIKFRGKLEKYRSLVYHKSFVAELEKGLNKYLVNHDDPDSKLLNRNDVIVSADFLNISNSVETKRTTIEEILGRRGGMSDILEDFKAQNSDPIPILIENGIPLIVQNFDDEELKNRLINIIQEIGKDIAKKEDKTKVKKHLDSFSEIVKQGKNIEKVLIWANKFISAVRVYLVSLGNL